MMWEAAGPGIPRAGRPARAGVLGAVHPVPGLRHRNPPADLLHRMNARLRKVTRNRGQFSSGQAVLKVLYLAVRNLAEYRRPNVGIRSSGWK
jgi:putative transposase